MTIIEVLVEMMQATMWLPMHATETYQRAALALVGGHPDILA